MAIIYECDGCGKQSDKPFQSIELREGGLHRWTADVCVNCRNQVKNPNQWPRAEKASHDRP